MEVAPDAPEPYHAYGTALLERGDYASAREYIARSLDVDPDYEDALVAMGFVLARFGQPDAAEKHLKRVLEVNPDSASGFHGLGMVHKQRGEIEKAIESFQRACNLSENHDRQAVRAYMEALAAAGRAPEAVAFLESELKAQPNALHFWMLLSEVHTQQGSYADAIASLRKGLSVAPYDAPTANALAWLLATSPEATRESGQEAVALAERALAVGRPSNAWAYLDTLAAAHGRAGNFEDAVTAARLSLDRLRQVGKMGHLEAYTQHLKTLEAGQPITEP
jgi:tetratricopeptide (TPR) repeat protein